jgi:hypothetical protein
MEAMLGISLCSYPYLNLAKTLCLPYCSLCLLFNKIGEEGKKGSAWKRGGGRKWEGAGGSGEKWPKQCMHIRINEFKKRKKENKPDASGSRLLS